MPLLHSCVGTGTASADREPHTPTQLTPARVIDHNSYPDIIDTILSHADTQLLLSFRATASVYADRCLRDVAHHLVVDGTPSAIEIKSARGGRPCLTAKGSSYVLALMSALGRRRGDGMGLIPNAWLPHCRILDIQGRGTLVSALGVALPNLRALRILPSNGRRHACSLATYSAPLVVMFGCLPEYDRLTDMFYLWPGNDLPRTQHLVWTISRISSAPPLFLGSNVAPYAHQVRSATIHFRVCRPARDVDRMFAWLAGIVDDIVEYVISGVLTIVDLEVVRGEGVAEDFEARRVELVRQLGRHVGRLVLMTGAEYCRVYGEEQYRIETCERLE